MTGSRARKSYQPTTTSSPPTGSAEFIKRKPRTRTRAPFAILFFGPPTNTQHTTPHQFRAPLGHLLYVHTQTSDSYAQALCVHAYRDHRADDADDVDEFNFSLK